MIRGFPLIELGASRCGVRDEDEDEDNDVDCICFQFAEAGFASFEDEVEDDPLRGDSDRLLGRKNPLDPDVDDDCPLPC